MPNLFLPLCIFLMFFEKFFDAHSSVLQSEVSMTMLHANAWPNMAKLTMDTVAKLHWDTMFSRTFLLWLSPLLPHEKLQLQTSIWIFLTSQEIKKSLPVEWKLGLRKSIFLCSPMTDDHNFFWKCPLIVNKYFCEVLRKNIIPDQSYSKKSTNLLNTPRI